MISSHLHNIKYSIYSNINPYHHQLTTQLQNLHLCTIFFAILSVSIGVINKLDIDPKNPVGFISATGSIIYDRVERSLFYEAGSLFIVVGFVALFARLDAGFYALGLFGSFSWVTFCFSWATSCFSWATSCFYRFSMTLRN
jgi:ABC-type glucose/galactose transport system permease subunit